jgi:hypothetical protein
MELAEQLSSDALLMALNHSKIALVPLKAPVSLEWDATDRIELACCQIQHMVAADCIELASHADGALNALSRPSIGPSPPMASNRPSPVEILQNKYKPHGCAPFFPSLQFHCRSQLNSQYLKLTGKLAEILISF